jgi:L-threonylcarbamoyladenylate synthase
MKRFIAEPDHLSQLAALIKEGGVVAYPTEAMFGLGCDPMNREAVARLCALKERSLAQGLILACASFEQTLPLVRWDQVSALALRAVRDSWPGPTTWVLPATDLVPGWIRGDKSGVAVRISAHTPITTLCETLNSAMVSTSANLHGLPPAKSPDEVQMYFGRKLDGLLDAPIGDLKSATKIFDASTGHALRE